MSRKEVSIVRDLTVAAVAALVISTQAQAQDRADVLERIKPVGQVAVEGQAAPAPAAPAAPAVAEAAAPAADAAAPAEEAAPAETAEPAAAAAPVAATGGDAQAIAQAKGCLACHQIEMKVVGPAYKDVAAKYKSDAAAVDTLVAKVQAGGVGTWGQIPMPPQAHVPEAEIRTVVEWIMSL